MGDHRVQCRVMGQQNSCKTLTGVHLTTHHVMHPNKGLAANMCMYVWAECTVCVESPYLMVSHGLYIHTE